ncbi:GSCFA domain-containing protein [Pseudalgibacter alginicilyticus]|uniref:GSCFA domain-containing protein n=1 Tax=Pseudalgibacter alginicilyticus TaxID=1736674 RepID=A0A0P0D7I6_9FLAO|nr:GSCFA domain-containing protein [Pseudalgibacter alginicilyticus]ALJ06082.1 GSCFA domain-containing protein [Pseudalgibacter alginicilyticus]
MKLQTQIPSKKQESNILIDYTANVLLLGSCFSENIGKKLEYFKFKYLQNPFGILFHPKAIETLISNAVNEKEFAEKDVFFHNEQWHCFDAHSVLSNVSKKDLIDQLNSQIELTNQQICNATHIIITLGTAWVYTYVESKLVVANCHKVPQKQFDKALLSIEEITILLKNIVDLVAGINNKATIIFTVSPIRHLKDGFVENTQSKAHLISAIHQMLDSNGKSSNVGAYFPSYEIMMDELRDYRFYSEDMIHPNQTAINYIWEIFKAVWISEDALKVMNNVDIVQKGLQHRPFNEHSEAHQRFLEKLEVKKHQLQTQFPHINF